MSFNKNEIEVYHKGIDLRTYKTIWLSSTWKTRDIAYAVHLYLDSQKINHTYTEKSSSKITDQMQFALNDLPIPNTWYSSNNNISFICRNIVKTCKYPIIIKDSFGSQGKNVAFILNAKQLVKKQRLLNKTKNYFIQEFIENKYE